MTGKTHMIGGAAATAAYMLTQPPASPLSIALVICTGTLGGLVPDIDHRGSKISKRLRFTSRIVSLFCSHRGLCHTPLLYLAIWGVWQTTCSGQPRLYGNALFLGVASHLLLDVLTPAGIPLFFPFVQEKVHILGIRTDGYIEKCLRVVLFVTASFLVMQLFRRV